MREFLEGNVQYTQPALAGDTDGYAAGFTVGARRGRYFVLANLQQSDLYPASYIGDASRLRPTAHHMLGRAC